MRRHNVIDSGGVAYSSKELIEILPNIQPNTGWPTHKRKAPREPWTICFFITPAVSKESWESCKGDWPERENPVTQSNFIDTEEDQVQELIFKIKTSLTIPYREILANRLLTLLHDAKEEDPSSYGIAAGSLRNFVSFLQSHANLKCPSISLTPDGDIYISWKSDKKKVFSVLFSPNGITHYVIFKPNVTHPEHQDRIAGTTTTDMLMENANPHGVIDWISE